jgi:hypothetical protein
MYAGGRNCTCDFEGWPICMDFSYYTVNIPNLPASISRNTLMLCSPPPIQLAPFQILNDDLLLGLLLILFLANIQGFGLRDVLEIGFDSPLLEKDAHGRLFGHPQHVRHIRHLQHHGGE